VAVTRIGHIREHRQSEFGYEGPLLAAVVGVEGVEHAVVGADVDHLLPSNGLDEVFLVALLR